MIDGHEENLVLGGAVILLLLAGIFLPMFNTVSVSSASAAWLSPARLSLLKKRVEAKQDADAALRIQKYYERNKHDPALSFLWLQRAAELGNPGARDSLKGIENGDPEIHAEINAWAEKGRKKEASGQDSE